MTNPKYLKDIKNFSHSWDQLNAYLQIKIPTPSSRRIILAGMWGSSSFVHLFNQFLSEYTHNKIEIISDYSLPKHLTPEDLIIISSYSGNTEESLSCLRESLSQKIPIAIMSAGGQLKQASKNYNLPLFELPGGFQPRMWVPYQLQVLLSISLQAWWITERITQEFIKSGESIGQYTLDKEAQSIAKIIKGRIPIIYATSSYESLCRIIKIKFNENTKIQSWFNVFPELNHNEMVGYTQLLGDYIHILYTDESDHPQNIKRQEIMADLLEKKWISTLKIPLLGKSFIEKAFYGIHFWDLITYYLAWEYWVDPEPVDMVEEFKTLLG